MIVNNCGVVDVAFKNANFQAKGEEILLVLLTCQSPIGMVLIGLYLISCDFSMEIDFDFNGGG